MSLPDCIPVNVAIDRTTLSDGRGRFCEIVAALNADHGEDLPDARSTNGIFTSLGVEPQGQGAPVSISDRLEGVTVIAVPGFLTECVSFMADCLTDGLAHLESLGARTSIAPMAGRGGCAENARRLRDHVLRDHALKTTANAPQNGTVGALTILVPMSKGAADTLEMLALYPETADKIDAIVSLVGCIGGSPLHGMTPNWLKWIERVVPMPTCARFNGAATDSLSPQTRTAFLETFKMPSTIRAYSLCAAVENAAGMSAGMMAAYRALSRITPLNDGQMLLADQLLPGATFLGALNCDHIATGMPFNRNRGLLARFVTGRLLNRNAFPREIILEAMVRYVLEDCLRQEREEN